ncbi:MAG TPA: leucine--tRNA ligase [Patescibacteria group bacterium]|nr:leucine--tRNA ligase [Patescibacteria group bacterium]
MNQYDPSKIEAKWQKKWEESGLYQTDESGANKKYVLDMFPYPSGATLHVGHIEGYVGTDIISRYFRMKGASVLHPMGWDAFGLPAENYAIKTGIHPDESTHENIKTFKRQLRSVGLSYDWSHEIDTSSPEYYRWTQWLFTLFFKMGLAYKQEADVNWCPSCETVLANEQVVDGKCERSGDEVIKKKLNQWFFKITDYADRLIDDLAGIDWLEEVKTQQKNWIGRSDGALIEFKIDGLDREINVFTTRPDTLYGATFLVLSPEHPVVEEISNIRKQISKTDNDILNDPYDIEDVKSYVAEAKAKSDADRRENKEKTGVFSGLYCINPVSGEKIPVWIADYVLMGYGTGAIMAVPAHDERDFEFATKFNLPIKQVIFKSKDDTTKDLSEAYVGSGVLKNSGDWDGLMMPDEFDKVISDLDKKKIGEKKTTYHLRDWLISRQRYWGVPIPMIYCESCAHDGKSWFTENVTASDSAAVSAREIASSSSTPRNDDYAGWYPAPESDLPILLPHDVDFRPTGKSPIALSKSFQEGVTCPGCGGPASREVDTMDTFVDSSWYFLRFVDPKNEKEFASREAIAKWLPVDVYVGGGHVVQHLLFARFFWKVIFDAGYIEKSLGEEPFLKLRAPGWILGPDSRKMSKRWHNVVTPDDIIPKYGADTLRMYEMFLGPFDAMKPWSLTGVEGMSRFIKKIYRLFEETHALENKEQDKQIDILLNSTIKKITDDIEGMRFNTAISTMMEFYNDLTDAQKLGTKINWSEVWEKFLRVMAPFAPHLAEELWQRLAVGGLGLEKTKSQELTVKSQSIHTQNWPEYDEKYLVQDEVVIPVQVNGKRRGEISIEYSVSSIENKARVEERAREVVASYVDGVVVKKVVYVPGKIINFVI